MDKILHSQMGSIESQSNSTPIISNVREIPTDASGQPLDPDHIAEIQYCYHCGRKDHCNGEYHFFTCKYETDRDGNTPESFCQKCGRSDHGILDCYAKTTYDGMPLN